MRMQRAENQAKAAPSRTMRRRRPAALGAHAAQPTPALAAVHEPPDLKPALTMPPTPPVGCQAASRAAPRGLAAIDALPDTLLTETFLLVPFTDR